jgi:hypothetical protein
MQAKLVKKYFIFCFVGSLLHQSTALNEEVGA